MGEAKVDPVEKKISVEKGRRGILMVVFGRTTIFALILLIQILVLLFVSMWLQERINVAAVYVFYQVFMAVLVVYIINRSENPAFKLAWIVPILILPVSGALIYVFVKLQTGNRILNQKILKLEQETKEYAVQDPQVMEDLRERDMQVSGIATYLSEKAGFPVYKNTTAKYFPLGEDNFEEIKVQLRAAKHFIFLEYFIIEEGEMWNSILEILVEKVKEGVEVRMMYDGTCTFSLLPYSYPKKMQELGIKCKVFAQVVPLLTTSQNNRDHRKILVIDGETAFTGGINLADEYINKKVRFGHWKDVGVMIQGEAVKSFTLMFLRMWELEKNEEDYRKYIGMTPFPCLDKENARGYVIPYGDSPLDTEQVGEQVYMQLLYTAKRYVHIMTPYLILDQEMLVALQFAAKRGVDVKLILPHIPDKKYAFALAKSHYRELIDAGVKIYEYTPGFVHAKSFVVDGEQAVVGTINLDYRSMYLHFECAVYMYDVPEILEVERDFSETLEKSQEVTLETVAQEKLVTRLVGHLLKLFAPLM